jgi:hypothetical protein
MTEQHRRRPIYWRTTGLAPQLWPDLEMVDVGGIREFESHPK